MSQYNEDRTLEPQLLANFVVSEKDVN